MGRRSPGRRGRAVWKPVRGNPALPFLTRARSVALAELEVGGRGVVWADAELCPIWFSFLPQPPPTPPALSPHPCPAASLTLLSAPPAAALSVTV